MNWISLLVAISFVVGTAPKGHPLGQAQPIGPKTDLERPLAAGDQHEYSVDLEEGSFLYLVAEQRGVDLVIHLYDEAGRLLMEVDRPSGAWGGETLQYVTEKRGLHRILIEPFPESVGDGLYRLKVHELRPALPSDRKRIEQAKELSRAVRLSRQGARREAISIIQESVDLLRQTGDSRGEAEALINLGRTLIAEHRYQDALECNLRAEQLSRQSGESALHASALYNVGLAYGWLNQTDRAVECYQEALDLFRQLGHLESQALALNNIAVNYDNRGEPHRAIELYRRALDIHLRLGLRRRGAGVRNNLAMALWGLGENQQALTHLGQALPTLRSLEDRWGEANALTNLGAVHWTVGAHQQSVDHLQQALRLWRQIGDSLQEATTLTNLGHAYTKLGEPSRALELFQKALEISRTLGNRAREGHTLSTLGSAYLSLGRHQEAEAAFKQSLQIRQATGNRWGQSRVLHQMGKSLINRGAYFKAAANLSQARQLAIEVGDRPGEASILYETARLHKKRGQVAQALEPIRLAVEISESLRTKVDSHNLRASYLARQQDVYELYLEILLDNESAPPVAEAFRISELSRARTLLEMLQEADLDSTVDESLRIREKANQIRLSRLQTELRRQGVADDSEKLEQIKAQILDLEKERTQLEAELRIRDPRLDRLKNPRIPGLGAIQRALSQGEALVEYFLGQRIAFALVVRRHDARLLRLAQAERIEHQVDQLLESMSRPGRRNAGRYRRLALDLYQELMAPLEGHLAGTSRLVIIPHGALFHLPFEALLRSGAAPNPSRGFQQLDYLLRHWSIRYVQSAQVYQELQRNASAKVRLPDESKSLVAFADPIYPSGKNTTTSQSGWTGVRLRRLPESLREAQSIGALYGRDRTSLFVGAEASEENLKNNPLVSSAQVLHLAAHGLVREDRPNHSGLFLSYDSDPAEDGILQVFEIFKLRLQADLVVLSACESGKGRQLRGEGVLGLTRAFLYAGAPSLVVSLWQVADGPTADFMLTFHRQLRTGGSKSDALRSAKLEAIQSGTRSHPFYWAPFVLIGNE